MMTANPRRGDAAALRNTGWMVFNQVLGMGLRLGYVLLAARLLAAETYGLLAYAQSWYIVVMPMALLGISIQLGRALGADPARGLAFAAQTRAWRLAVALLASGAVVVLATCIEPEREQAMVICVFALALVPRVLSLGSEAVLTGLERGDQTLANHLTWRAAELASAVVALLAGGGILALAWLHLASWTAQSLTGYRRERRLARDWPDPRPADGAAAALFRDGLQIALAATVNGLLIGGLLILFRLMTGSSDQLGAVALCLQMVGMLIGLAVAVGNALLPYLARRDRQADDPLPRRLLCAGLALAAFGAAAGLPMSGPWLPALLGVGFTPLVHWLPLLPLFAGLILAETLLARLLVVQAGTARLLPIAVVAIGSAFLAAPVLILTLGGVGVLMAALLGYALQAMLMALAVIDALGLPRRGLWAPWLGFALTVVIVLMAGAAPLHAALTLLLIGSAAAIGASGRFRSCNAQIKHRKSKA